MFDTFVYIIEDKQATAADLVLECACTVADKNNHQIERFKKTFQIDPSAGVQGSPKEGFPGEHGIVRDDVRYYDLVTYTAEHEIDERFDNQAEAEKKAEYYFKGELLKFQTAMPVDQSYNGVKPIYCDGAIHQVTWSLGLGGIYMRRAETRSTPRRFCRTRSADGSSRLS